MNEKRLLIFGMGFSAVAIGRRSQSEFTSIMGTSRSSEKIAALQAEGFNASLFDGEALTTELAEYMQEVTHVVVSIAPGEADPVLACLPKPLRELCPRLQWVGYLSTVGVYGNHDGQWVNEKTETKPVSKRSIQRVIAEAAWQTECDRAECPLAIFRLSGIYGPGRNAFTTIEKGRSRRLIKPGQVFNRIHRDDIAEAVFLALRDTVPGIFNITDNEPAPPQDVITYAHELMGTDPPAEIDFETADISPMARSFYGENKRVSNAKSKRVLGMEYKWPDYHTSLKRMWQEKLWA
ncbi:MAG: SDR family oxidoreductase [Pseudomonadota bacterium]